jgi:choloylglycine hydrolase
MCSGIRIICKDGVIMMARTLEFNYIFDYKLYNDENIIGIIVDSYFLDGLNKNGLCVMSFYFPEFAQYTNEIPEGNLSLMSLDVTGYLLKHAANINDVQKLIKNITVNEQIFPTFGTVIPLHWFVSDKSGKSIVIESVNGVLNSYENKAGILTNSPTYPTHLLSLQAFPEFSRYNNPRKTYSEGTGMNGLPGDFSSISRFVRLSVYQDFHDKPNNGVDGLATAFHILNNFDIVKGYVENKEGNKEFTQYTVVYNLNNFKAWYKSYENVVVRNLVSEDIILLKNKNNDIFDILYRNIFNNYYIILFLIVLILIVILMIINQKYKLFNYVYKLYKKNIMKKI